MLQKIKIERSDGFFLSNELPSTNALGAFVANEKVRRFGQPKNGALKRARNFFQRSEPFSYRIGLNPWIAPAASIRNCLDNSARIPRPEWFWTGKAERIPDFGNGLRAP